MQIKDITAAEALGNVPPVLHEVLKPSERDNLKAEIKTLLKSKNAVLVAHYYTDSEIQVLADETGGYVSDSLDMARFGRDHSAATLVVAGVRFMGETAKILSPEKRVLVPDLAADCSLDLGCDVADFGEFCDAHPERTVVVYANTSAGVKARADWMVTSGSALEVVRLLDAAGKKILWAPDQHLGQYIQNKTGADMILWQGACVVHEEFKGVELRALKKKHPDARVLVHPESPEQVIAQADYVGSTSGLISQVVSSSSQKFIVATDKGIFHKMRESAPGKELIAAPTAGKSATCTSCAECPWMAMNGLRKIRDVLTSGGNEINVSADTAAKARVPINRLLNFADNNNRVIFGNNDA